MQTNYFYLYSIPAYFKKEETADITAI